MVCGRFFRVLADERYFELVFGILRAFGLDAHFRPGGYIELAFFHAQFFERKPGEVLRVQSERDLVQIVRCYALDDAIPVDVAEHRQLLFGAVVERIVGTANDNIGLDTDILQFLDGVLRRLCLVLATHFYNGHERDVDIYGIALAELVAALTYRFEIRVALYIADHAAYLANDKICLLAVEAVQRALYLVGYVRNDLDGLAVVVAVALALDDRGVDLTARYIAVFRQVLIEKTLVMPEHEIALAAVVGDKDLAVLIRAEVQRVDVEIRVELDHIDRIAARFEQHRHARRRYSLAKTGHNAAGHENVFRHSF